MPSNWNYLFRGYNPPDNETDYNGIGWYRRTFNIPKDYYGHFIKLYFGAICYKVVVWINGEIVGTHEGDFIPFEFDITNKLKYGEENDIAVRVESINDKTEDSVPPRIGKEGGSYDFWVYSGIYRDAYIEALDKLNIFDLYVNAIPYYKDNKASLEIEFTLLNVDDMNGEGSIEFFIYNNSNVLAKKLIYNVSTPPQAYTTYKVDTEINDVKLWSAESPYLYKCIAKLSQYGKAIDEVGVNFGIREIKVNNKHILVNNKKVLLKGINRHDEYPPYGRAIPLDMYEKDIQYIKSAYINALRTAHYPNNPEIYDLSDKKGLYVFEEIPVGKFVEEDFYNEHILNLAKKYLKTMIYRDRNHPSIIIWSIGNEYHSESLGGKKYTKDMIDYVHSLDKNRLVTFASDKELNDISMGYTDVISINEYLGWYKGEIEDVSVLLDSLHLKYSDKPTIISEFGADAIKNKRDYKYSYSAKHFSEDFQSYFLKNSWDIIKSKDFVGGGFIWIFADFLSPKRKYLKSSRTPKDIVVNPIPYHNLKGILTEDRIPKNAYLTVMGMYGDKKTYDLYVDVVNKFNLPLNNVIVDLYCGNLLCGEQNSNLAGKTILWSIPEGFYNIKAFYGNRQIKDNIYITNTNKIKLRFKQ